MGILTGLQQVSTSSFQNIFGADSTSFTASTLLQKERRSRAAVSETLKAAPGCTERELYLEAQTPEALLPSPSSTFTASRLLVAYSIEILTMASSTDTGVKPDTFNEFDV